LKNNARERDSPTKIQTKTLRLEKIVQQKVQRKTWREILSYKKWKTIKTLKEIFNIIRSQKYFNFPNFPLRVIYSTDVEEN